MIWIVLILVALGVAFALKNKKSTPEAVPEAPVVPVEPGPPTRKLDIWYFCAGDGQYAATKDHVTMFMEAFWGGDDAGTARLVEANMPSIVAITSCSFLGTKYLGQSESTRRLRLRFEALRAAGVLSNIKVLFMYDEPEVAGVSDSDLGSQSGDIRAVAGEFPELAGVKLYINYGREESYPGLPYVDLASLDDYGSMDFGKVDRLRAQLRPEQGLVLVPGCANPWKNDLAPFYEYANGHAEVYGIMIFIWMDFFFEGEQLGVANNGLAPMCQKYGKLIKDYA